MLSNSDQPCWFHQLCVSLIMLLQEIGSKRTSLWPTSGKFWYRVGITMVTAKMTRWMLLLGCVGFLHLIVFASLGVWSWQKCLCLIVAFCLWVAFCKYVPMHLRHFSLLHVCHQVSLMVFLHCFDLAIVSLYPRFAFYHLLHSPRYWTSSTLTAEACTGTSHSSSLWCLQSKNVLLCYESKGSRGNGVSQSFRVDAVVMSPTVLIFRRDVNVL